MSSGFELFDFQLQGTTKYDFLENICARPIFSKSSVFFCTVGPDWEE
jgi:hypothetical protein